MKIALINSLGKDRTFASKIFEKLRGLGADVTLIHTHLLPQAESENVKFIKPAYFPVMRQKLNEAFHFPKHIPEGYDVYGITNQNIANYMKYIRKPKVLTVHHINPKSASINDFISRIQMGNFRLADRIIAISEHTKKDLVQKFKIPPEKIRVVYHGVDDRSFYPMEKEACKKELGFENKTVVLNVGTEEPRKNIDVLLKSFYIARQKLSNIVLVRVGPKSEKSAKLIEKLGLEKDVIYLPFQEEESLARIYSAADVFVMPTSYEGFGLTALEAMKCGTPVVCSNAASMPEVVGDAAIKLEPWDIEGYSREIANVLASESLSSDMIRKGIEQAKKFSWEKCARETLEVYEGLK